jgi:hypothetical protein
MSLTNLTEFKKEDVMKYRHGYVLISKTDSVRGNKLKNLVLAEGEVTGHSHKITSGKAELYQDGDTLYLHVEEDATLTHEEHKPLTLPVGDYEIKIQREYEPEGWRYVAD